MTDSTAYSTVQEEGLRFGPYRILELIGAGGMAEVYRAVGPGRGGETKDLVIKRIRAKYAGNDAFEQMFRDEARLSMQLRHPNLVEVFDSGDVDGHPYMAMEYIDGLHLQAMHVRHVHLARAPLPVDACVTVVRDLLRGLHYAHELCDDHGAPMGLVHRDVNLVNVMVRRDGRVKVLDFGIVKAVDGVRSAETVGSVLKGKFAYMSPEQAEGKPVDRRSDVFSAGVVLQELVTGRRLFFGGDDLAILRKVRRAEVPDPRRYRPELPDALAAVLQQALARDREARFPTAAAMADALEQVARQAGWQEDATARLMRALMPPPADETDAMRRRRRKVTLLAWQSGVREASRSVAGEVVVGNAAASTAPGKGLARDGDGAEADGADAEAAPIQGEVRWLAPEGADVDPVLGEQDTSVVTLSGAEAEATLLLPDDDAWMGSAAPGAADAGPPGAAELSAPGPPSGTGVGEGPRGAPRRTGVLLVMLGVAVAAGVVAWLIGRG